MFLYTRVNPLLRSLIGLLSGTVFLLSMLTGCGFQLRGSLEITDDVSPLYLQQKSAFTLAREIKQLLASNKVKVTDNASRANSWLTLEKEKRDRRVLSVDSNGRVREYLLIYDVDFSIGFDVKPVTDENEISKQDSIADNLGMDIIGNKNTDDSNGVATMAAVDNVAPVEVFRETISVKRTLFFDQDAVLAVSNEAGILFKDMQKDVARLILLKVQAYSNERKTDSTSERTEDKPGQTSADKSDMEYQAL